MYDKCNAYGGLHEMAAGKAYRQGIDVMEMADMFATEDKARRLFEDWLWGGERCCVRCGSENTYKCSHKTMPYRCRDCGRYFSVRTGTAMERSKVPLRKWGWAIYFELTNLKGVSSVKLARDLAVSQTTAWFMQHRIREAFAGVAVTLSGIVEVDEAYFGGRRANMSNKQAAKNCLARVAARSASRPSSRQRIGERRTLVARVIDHTDKADATGFRGRARDARTPSCTRTTRRPTRARTGTTRRSTIRSTSSCATWLARRFTPTAWNRSGRC